MRPVRSACLLAALLVAFGAAAAEASVRAGTYKGKFSDGGTVSLVVNKNQLLVKVARQSMRFKCSDGDSFRALKHTATGTVPVGEKKFDIADERPGDGVVWQMTGKYSSKKKKWTGTYQETRRFNSSNQLDGDGKITCQTAALTYSAVIPN